MTNTAEYRKKWVKALRSGKYPQGTGGLCRNLKFCCLGVAAEIANQEVGLEVSSIVIQDDEFALYDGMCASLPAELMEVFGLRTGCGDYYLPMVRDMREYTANLACKNDAGMSFKDIADIIESEPEGMFVA